MSLHTLAQHLQSAGRGDDKMLVHMTPGEVSGLQSLAMAHGGSLTINPETGLPEAGFLSAILPMVAGAALGPAGAGIAFGGLSSAASAGLLVGAAGAVATGSLGKGLMMGLGAYGGAGMAPGLLGTGAGATPTAIPASSVVKDVANPATFGQTYGSGAMQAGMMPPAVGPATSPLNVQGYVPGTALQAVNPQEALARNVVQTAPSAPAGAAPSVEKATEQPGFFSRLFGGAQDQQKDQDQSWWQKNKQYAIPAGIATISLSREEMKPPKEEGQYQPFNTTWNRIMQSGGQYQAGPYTGTSERNYRLAADGGLMSLPVEQMSQQASVGANTNYPMANIRPYGYAVPRNVPVSENVFKPMDYQRTDPYTGEQKFAGGGLASLVSMATGGFVSKLKAVPKPTEVKPKLQSTAALDKQIAGLEKYSNIDEVKGRYSDLQNQIKDLQASKKDRDAQAAQAAKDYNAAIAAINKEKTANLTSLNADFANRIRQVQADKGIPAKEKQATIAGIQKEQKEAQTGLNTDFANRIKDRQNEYKGYQTDLTAFNKDYSTQLAALNKDLGTAKNATTFATQYQTAVANRDKMLAANEAATNKVREQNEAAMAKYNEYQDALNAEKQAWQEETGRKATGIQAIRPQTTTTALDNKAKIAELEKQKAALSAQGYNQYGGGSASVQAAEIQKQIDSLKTGATSAGYTPAYVKDPKTGKLIPSSEAPPITEFKAFTKVPGYDTTKRLMEEKDISAVFEDVAGRRPTAAEMDKFLGTQSTDAAIAQYAMNLADVKQTMKYTDDDFKENFQYYIGRQPTSGELASMKKANITNFNQMRNFLQQQPAYLKNLNTVAQQAFTGQQKTAEEAATEQQRMAASLSPEAVSTAYRDVLGRQPTMEELRQYMGAQKTPEGLAGMLKKSDEYLTTLTKPLVPTPTAAPKPTVAPISFTKYAPGTTLEYTPEKAATGLGAITGGLQATRSGLQAPLTRGAVTLEGAMPLNPTFQEQMGLQTLATQAAEKAPQLQTGLQFGAAQPQNMFGFQPSAAGQTPQTIEQMIAAYKEAQLKAMPPATPMAEGGYAGGGYNLGDYSDGGRLLKGPGDGISDSIPASIGNKQPARLADGEFVIPARIVSELGNGSTDAGARKLYAMMDRIQRARRKSIGSDRVAVDSRAEKMLPA